MRQQLINARIPKNLVERVEQVAHEQGLLMPSGRANRSQALRYIITIGLASIKNLEAKSEKG